MNKTTQATTPAVKRSRVFYGWWIVLGASLQALWTSGTFFYGFSAFFNPIVREFGWSRAATATALSIQRTEAGIAGPFVGFLVDRYGARGVMLIGTVLTSAGFFLMARISSLWTFYGAVLLIALGLSMASMITTTPVVGNWFRKHRSRAMTIAFAGGGMGGIMAPVLVWGVATIGWRGVLDWIAVGWLLLGIPVSLLMRHRPEPYGYLPDGIDPRRQHVVEAGDSASADTGTYEEETSLTVREMLRTPAFWQLIVGMGVAGLLMSSIVVFSIPALESYGIATATAGITVMFLSILNLTGRFTLGFLADRIDKRYILALTYVLMSLGTLMFAFISEGWHIIVFLLLYAPGHGGTVPVRFALLADYFGRKSYGALVGITMTLTAGFSIIGPVFAGWMFDVTGVYRWAFLIMALLAAPAVPLTLMVKQPQK